MKKSLKISEIAEYLGVSRPTVSYVLNDRWKKRGISETTANRILEYVRETGFLPNPASLALQGRAIKDIAILVPPDALEHQKRAFFSLLELLEKSGKSYMMFPLTENRLAETVQIIKMYRIPRVMAITTPISWDFQAEWGRLFKNLPDIDCFFYDFPFERMNADKLLFSHKSVAVGIDRKKAKTKALRYLFSQGYRHLILPKGHFDEKFLKTRLSEFRVDFYRVQTMPSLFNMGRALAEQLVKLVKKVGHPAAVYINDDLMSASVMKCLREKGISVPEDIAILSWDGLPESDYFIEPLSTCVIPHDKMLRAAIDWLEDKPMVSSQIIFDIEIRKGKTFPTLCR